MHRFVGLSLLISFESHHLVSFAFVLRVTKRFPFFPLSHLRDVTPRKLRSALLIALRCRMSSQCDYDCMLDVFMLVEVKVTCAATNLPLIA